ncbi:Hypothetical predicted protein [Pelobates cultripes]|uniref:Uncharacterized protein n=1 Tax=Pelobates cultripes TaxID=61616 RepID=A0AAD1WC58_PELCU|nr:Hypothetical predicted protein [Pelobates cultripes]
MEAAEIMSGLGYALLGGGSCCTPPAAIRRQCKKGERGAAPLERQGGAAGRGHAWDWLGGSGSQTLGGLHLFLEVQSLLSRRRTLCTKCPPQSHPSANYVELKERESGGAESRATAFIDVNNSVLTHGWPVPPIPTYLSSGVQDYRPSLTICCNRDPYETKLKDGRYPEGYLPLSEEVNHK